ncbi:LysR substrate-binding domain-containing protein [Rhizobium sp. CC-YZS058]|uniref:LysR substrate-binding domain-containing protein n=1 Tax=Rhizobium sp. CC-YZS058 TaxID=3042153 RepID=UPI002B06250E|nr:LysR substrate-binding domain-containing protein [Rhizobium sp. CC-YZS058]MEA3535169.1 LysR substrate-binding domain-containing protein [Rhizobium sp. CC-YZS058]
MQDLNDIAHFVAVVRHGGFSAAARALDLPKSLLSKHVAELERQLGVRLLERSTRMLRVTDVGQHFFDHCEQALASIEAAEAAAAMARSAPRGLVRLACPLGFAPLLSFILPEFHRRFPEVTLRIIVSNRRVDLVSERIDVALRARPEVEMDEQLVVRRMGDNASHLVASPSLIDRLGQPTIDTLSQFPTLSMAEERAEDHWSLISTHGERRDIVHRPLIGCGDFNLLETSAIEGIGVALLPEHMTDRAIRAGLLVRVLPDWSTDAAVAHLVFTTRQGMLPAVRALIDHFAEMLPATMARCREVDHPQAAKARTALPRPLPQAAE